VHAHDFQKMPAKAVEAWLRRWYIAPTIFLPTGKRTTIMAHSHRRQFLKDLLGTLAQGAGAIVLASAAAARATAQATTGRDADIQKRAEDLARAAGANEEELEANGAIRNVGVGGVGFRNAAFRNGGGFGGGAFRNAAVGGGGFGGGAFRNGGFANGGFGGGAFRNAAAAGGFGGGAFRNGAFRNW
jgi:hypothetical protein